MKNLSSPKLKLARPSHAEPPKVIEDATPADLVARLEGAQAWTEQAVLPAVPPAGQGREQPPEGTLEEKVWPWTSTNERIKKGYSMRIPEPMLAKLEFLKQNEPNVSVHKLILLGIERELDARLPKHGWTGNNRHL